jgi:hypothetical protein
MIIKEAVIRSFLTSIWEKIDDVKNHHAKTSYEKLQLLAFSILVMLDGEDPSSGPFIVKPVDAKGRELEIDIAGNLHEEFYKIERFDIDPEKIPMPPVTKGGLYDPHSTMNKIFNFIIQLQKESFEGWTQDSINAYNTALISVKMKMLELQKEINKSAVKSPEGH